jgi:hypothetical protein
MSLAIASLLPRWTKRVSIEEGGRDPLGLSRVSAIITDFLLQGIITQTYRARYYSFYCWAIWHIDTEEHPKSYEQFATAFQRRDSLFGLASLQFNSSSSPVGLRVIEARLPIAKQSGDVACDFRPLPSNPLGAFGQYYTGSISELGLTSRDEQGIYHVSPAGRELALAFHQSIEDTPYVRKKLYIDRSLAWKDFVKTAAKFNLDYLVHASSERDQLTKLFFSENLKSDRALMRRSSLCLLLSIIAAYGESGVAVHSGDTWNLVYAPYYYGQLQLPKRRSRQWNCPPSTKTCVDFWQYFCLHQFVTQALENLLAAVLDILSAELSGSTVREICTRLTSDAFLEKLQEIHGAGFGRPYDLLQHLGVAVPDLNPPICRHNQLKFDLSHPSSESQILDQAPESAYERTAVAVSLLAILYAKWGGPPTDVARHISIKAGIEMHFESIRPYVVRWRDKHVTWADAMEPILSELILDQHDRVMYEKGKLESCWLHRIEGRVFKDQDYSPGYRSPRSDNSVSVLTDLCLLAKDSNDQLSVTGGGQSTLGRFMP